MQNAYLHTYLFKYSSTNAYAFMKCGYFKNFKNKIQKKVFVQISI